MLPQTNHEPWLQETVPIQYVHALFFAAEF